MTRPLRVQIPGGTYHVTARGNSKLPIYRDHGYRMAEIAEELGCHYATVSRRLHAWEGRQMS